MTRFAALLMLVSIAGCTSNQGNCLVGSQQTVVALFFGRDIPGRAPLTDAEWSDFAASVVSKEFPDGFTVTDGDGEWRDPPTQSVTHERTKILIVSAPPSTDFAQRISRIRDSYDRMYRQTSVGVLTYEACGQF